MVDGVVKSSIYFIVAFVQPTDDSHLCMLF